MNEWTIERRRDRAARLHDASAGLVAGSADGSVRRTLRVLEATAPAVVLGRSQPGGHVDGAAAAAAGVDVVRRHSGGGAVLVGPGLVVWIDILIPAGDRLWSDDVGRAMWWVGEAWSRALADVGVAGTAVWRGAMVRSAWSDRVCFAGLGAGEVTAPGPDGPAKVVGVSQRRTRLGALFQCSVPVVWDPAPILGVLALDERSRCRGATELAGAALGIGPRAGALLEAAVRRLTSAGKAPDAGQLP